MTAKENAKPLRLALGSDHAHHSTADAPAGCFSVVERYQRLKTGQQRSSAGLKNDMLESTTRALLSNKLQSGELPSRFARRHLSRETQAKLRWAGQQSALEDDARILDHDVVPQRTVAGIIQHMHTRDLYQQNQEWLDFISLNRDFEATDLNYDPSSESTSASESEDETPCSLLEETPCSHLEESPCSHLEETPFRSCCPLSGTLHPAECSKKPPMSQTEYLVELARNGEFSELWQSLKQARGCETCSQAQGIDAQSIYFEAVETLSVSTELKGYLERSICQSTNRDGDSTYFDAIDTFVSQCSRSTAPTSACRLRPPGESSLRPAAAETLGSSFQTCEQWYEDGSDILPTDPLLQEPSGHRLAAMENWELSVRRMIFNRARETQQRQQRRERRVAVITRRSRRAMQPYQPSTGPTSRRPWLRLGVHTCRWFTECIKRSPPEAVLGH